MGRYEEEEGNGEIKVGTADFMVGVTWEYECGRVGMVLPLFFLWGVGREEQRSAPYMFAPWGRSHYYAHLTGGERVPWFKVTQLASDGSGIGTCS